MKRFISYGFGFRLDACLRLRAAETPAEDRSRERICAVSGKREDAKQSRITRFAVAQSCDS
jgi:hypothetical protein